LNDSFNSCPERQGRIASTKYKQKSIVVFLRVA
jgi:hypothetical protein